MSDNLDFRILHVPTNSDKAYRDTLCMAYICSVLDLPMSDFQTVVKPFIKDKTKEDELVNAMKDDLESRIRRLVGGRE